MTIRLPARYEDLDSAFRGRLRPVPTLIDVVKHGFKSMQVGGGIRFLPVFGKSGSGKTCAANELATHLPECTVRQLDHSAMASSELLDSELRQHLAKLGNAKLLILVIDQYEEAVAGQTELASAFVERLARLDRGPLRDHPMLFLWLTTDRVFQATLVAATSRNQRILLLSDFEINGPDKADWPSIMEETFSFHNNDASLPDLDILQDNLQDVSDQSQTLGAALLKLGLAIMEDRTGLQDLSTYNVVMVWPVTDGQRIARIQQFTDARQGYRLEWNAWLRQLNPEEQRQLTKALHAYNRARLYFDLRVVPINAADLHWLSKDLDSEDVTLSDKALNRFRKTHFYTVVSGTWDPTAYAPMRERDSERAKDAREWYKTVTDRPVPLGRRIAKALRDCGIPAQPEQEISTMHGAVRADVLAERPIGRQRKVIVELKAFSAERTMPSTICDQIRITLRRHAQLAGFIERQ